MTAVDTPHPRRHGKLVGRVMVYGLLAVLALAFLAPLITMLLTSLKSMDEIRAGNLFSLPQAPTLDAWRKVWDADTVDAELTRTRVQQGALRVV